MSMRGLIWLALLFAVAVALAIGGHFEHGHVIIIYPPRRIDLSLNLLVAGVVVAFIVAYVLVRGVRNVVKMPRRVAAYRTRSRAARAHAALSDAVLNFFAGRFARAEGAARKASVLGEQRDSAALIGAHASHRLREHERRDEWFEQIQTPAAREARALARADLYSEEPEHAVRALESLEEAEAQGARRLHAQTIALRAHQHMGNWSEVLRLTRVLEKRSAIAPQRARHLKHQALTHLFDERRNDGEALLAHWRTLSSEERAEPLFAALAVERLLQAKRTQDARRIIENVLASNWDARLIRRYGECGGDDPLPLIQRGEEWQQAHPDDVDLQFALGQLCIEQKLWGKAQSFLESAARLARGNAECARIELALARLHEALGGADKAAMHYRASALAAARSQPRALEFSSIQKEIRP